MMNQNPYQTPNAPLAKNKEFLICHNDDGNEIAFKNNFLGVESVFVNGVLISKKWSFRKSKHNFKIGDNEYVIKINLKAVSKAGIYFTITKNNNQIAQYRIYPGFPQILYLPIFVILAVLFVLIEHYYYQLSGHNIWLVPLIFTGIWFIIVIGINRISLNVERIE